MTPQTTLRKAAVEMLRHGHATVAEIAQLIGTSRQAVQYWADVAEIDAVKTRARFLKDAWALATFSAKIAKPTLTAKVAKKIPYAGAPKRQQYR